MCPAANSSMITVGNAKSFATITNGLSYTAPFKGITGPHEPLWVQQFVVGRLKGYITTLSLHGRYRRAENAAARKLHYPIMKFPYVPLTGPIVKDNPRMVLEVYESVYVFRSSAGAENSIANVFPADSPALQQGTVLRGLPRLGDQTMGYVRAFLPNNNSYEHVVAIFVRDGDLEVQVSTQGGKDISVADGVRFARLAVNRILDRCPTNENAQEP
jgi:hypothetical protein